MALRQAITQDQTAKHKPFDSEYYGTKIKKLLDMSLSNLTSQSAQQTPTASVAQRDAWRLASATHNEDRPLAALPRKEYLDKAVPKPEDGPNVKQDQTESCLTCVHFVKTCHGTDVEGGKCQQCRGASGETKTKRTCVWLDPDNNIFNYPDAFAAGNAKRNPHNTREGREARKKRLEAEDRARHPPQLLNEVANWPATRPLLCEAAGEIDAGGEESDAARLKALFDAVASRNFVQGDMDSLPERQLDITAQQVVLQTLRRMTLSGKGLSVEDIRRLASQDESFFDEA